MLAILAVQLLSIFMRIGGAEPFNITGLIAGKST
jgi:hypothetical protein